jgi:hypothetical protein
VCWQRALCLEHYHCSQTDMFPSRCDHIVLALSVDHKSTKFVLAIIAVLFAVHGAT